jgi:hypothetical protein
MGGLYTYLRDCTAKGWRSLRLSESLVEALVPTYRLRYDPPPQLRLPGTYQTRVIGWIFFINAVRLNARGKAWASINTNDKVRQLLRV